MIVVPHLEWHIIHNCNLSCEGCMHFTNHGHDWIADIDTLKKWYSYWNERISPKSMAILGGEPLLHKNLVEIIYLTKKMWKQPKDNSYFEVVTNGLLLDREKHKDLPIALRDTNCHLSLSIHGSLENKKYVEKIDKTLEILDEWKYQYNIKILITDMQKFWSRSYKGFGINSLPFEDNNPEKSWNNCVAGQKCFQLYEGNIYKCCMTAYLQLQKNKYGNLLSKKWDPYLKYVPLNPNCSDDDILEFFNRKSESVCGMCPANPKVFQKNDPLIPVSFHEKQNSLKKYYS